MPIGNNFQHAAYSRSDPGDRVGYPELVVGAPPDSLAWQDAMGEMGAQLAQAGVRLVVFLHGAMRGTDVFGMQRLDDVGGLKRGYSRGIAGLDALLALMREETNGLSAVKGGPTPPFTDDDRTKQLIDNDTRDAANFSHTYVELFRKALTRSTDRPIRCERVLWSSEQHHIGRSQAALHVISRLHAIAAEQQLGPGDRILVQAHGHAGLVMALVSNLLVRYESSGRSSLLHTLKDYAWDAGTASPGIVLLEQSLDRIFNGAILDIVTWGTPVRYGWDPSALGTLLHIVNHRPMRVDGKRWLAKMELPQITMEMPIAWGGDYVQQLAVAGSDAVPASPEAKAANKALWELLEPYEGFERWLECARKSVRCQNDGRCLLVDYKDSTAAGTVNNHLYGHAAYTRLNAMLFNTTQILQSAYTSAGM